MEEGISKREKKSIALAPTGLACSFGNLSRNHLRQREAAATYSDAQSSDLSDHHVLRPEQVAAFVAGVRENPQFDPKGLFVRR